MAHSVTKDYGSHIDVNDKLETLLDAVSGTVVSCGIIKVGADRFMAWVAEVSA
jgi:hypothetical protein